MISLIIPVYMNSSNIVPLLEALRSLHLQLDGELEVVFVVDGTPDDSYLQLAAHLPGERYRAQLLQLSRNFGAFAAIRAGLEAAHGPYFAVMAADLQEPPELIVEFARLLSSDAADIVFGQRISRSDPLLSRLASRLFWAVYRRFVLPAVPEGGTDIFACQKKVRDQISKLSETNSSLVGLLFWVGFRRAFVPYHRRAREHGISAWTFEKKLRYLMDSVYSFTDLPIRLLTRIGIAGLVVSVGFALVLLVLKVLGWIPVPGYTATVLTVIFFGALNCFGIGVIGNYVFRSFENTKGRPNHIVSSLEVFERNESQDQGCS